MRNHRFNKSSPPPTTTTTTKILPSTSKKNDDGIRSTRKNTATSYLRFNLQRWVLSGRIFTSIRHRLILFMIATMILGITMNFRILQEETNSPTSGTQTTSFKRGLYPPRMVQLGVTTISMRHRHTEGLLHLKGSGDPTLVTMIQSPLPKKGNRELIERYNPLPHDTPKHNAVSEVDKGHCHPMHEWQTTHRPTCNVVHESSFGFDHPLGWRYEDVIKENTEGSFDYNQRDADGKLFSDMNEQFRLAAGGAYRWVWMIREYDGTPRALKTLRVDGKSREFDLRNFDRHRRDAVALDQMTKSPLIVDIFGHCSNTALFDWGEGGDLTGIFMTNNGEVKTFQNEHILKIAYNLSMSVHDAHNFDAEGRATIAHTDIKTNQFLFSDGYYRLTDFNRVRFLLWNEDEHETCGFKVGKNGGKWRSPEEYAYELENEKVDVYSLGNVLYFLLTRREPWENEGNHAIYDYVQEGKRPQFPPNIVNSESIFDRYMIQAINMAWTHNPVERPGALQVAQRLMEGIQEYEKTTQNVIEQS